MPRISVIVPVYQAEKYLKTCVDSVKGQSFSDWELLLVDDGSTDGSPALCDGFAAGDNRVRALHQPQNAGVSQARNRAMGEAAGECILFLDADDAIEPDTLDTLWTLREENGADTAACALRYLHENGATSVDVGVPAGVYDRAGILEHIVYPLLGDRLAQPVFNGFMVRYLFSAKILREAGIAFEGAYLEDELFLMEYFCHARKLAATEKPLYLYYLHAASVTHKYMGDFQAVFDRFLERKEVLVRKYGLEEARPQWRENTRWAGLLIAIGNEYAKSNPKPLREKQRAVEELCAQPEMAQAIRALRPEGLGRNKQMVAALVRGGHFFLLSQLYRLKNR